MYRTKRFQNRVTTGRLTLPVVTVISVACWLLVAFAGPVPDTAYAAYPLWQRLGVSGLPGWLHSLLSFLLYGVIGYLLVAFNNTFAIIRMRASVQTSVFFLLTAMCPLIHRIYPGSVVAMCFLFTIFFMFSSYQQSSPMSHLFHAFAFLGLGSLAFPQLTWFAPLLWWGAYSFQSLSLRSFVASLVGYTLPYWFLLSHAFYHGQMDLFYAPFRELVRFAPLGFSLGMSQLYTLGVLLVLYIVSATHCLVASYDDKIRTRSYLNFLIVLCGALFLYIFLQNGVYLTLLPMLLIGVSILSGHLFVLTRSRASNLFFIGSLVALFIMFVINCMDRL